MFTMKLVTLEKTIQSNLDLQKKTINFEKEKHETKFTDFSQTCLITNVGIFFQIRIGLSQIVSTFH